MITLKEHNVKPYGELCAMLAKEQKCAYVAATGTGKSYVVGKYIEDRGLVEKTLALVPSNGIKDGWEKLLPGVTVTTYQALCNNTEPAQGKEIIVCDEMHHLGADVWGETYKAVIGEFAGKLIGITATPIRFLDHGRNMAEEFFEGEMVEGMDLPAAISAGILPSFDYITALYNVPKNIKEIGGTETNEYTESLFKRLDFLNSTYSVKNILKAHLSDGVHKAAVFVDQIPNIPEVEALCREAFPDAFHCVAHSKMKKSSAKRCKEKFSKQKGMSFIYTVDMLNEGVHIAGVDCVIMFRKTESPALYLQQLGRAMTADMAGRRVKVFDFVANHKNLKTTKRESDSVISWIADGISNPMRQIVIRDYALEGMELLERLKETVFKYWSAEEDALLTEKWNKGKGLEELEELLPHRSRSAIKYRARLLKLNLKPDYKAMGVYDAVNELYMEENGVERIQERFPDVSAATIRDIARRLGFTLRAANIGWSEEEDEMLRRMDAEGLNNIEQAERLGRTQSAVSGRRHILGLGAGTKHVWTEEELKILSDRRELTGKELQEQFFPDISVAVINTKRQKLGLSRKTRYTEEERELLLKLYAEGGAHRVAEDEHFKHMKLNAINSLAGMYGVKSNRNPAVAWTEDELNIIRTYLSVPEKDRPPLKTLEEKIPRHTFNAIRATKGRILRGEI